MTGDIKSFTTLAFKIAFTANLFSVIFNIINDCDETYNYWEPLHVLITSGKGGGFQTWEYSPSYALRSYTFLWLFGWPAYFVHILGGPTWLSFLAVRLLLAFISAVSVALLATALDSTTIASGRKCMPGLPLSLIFVCFFSLSPGTFLSATSLVPSAIACSMCNFMLAFWIGGHYRAAVGCVAFMGIVLWPFAAALGIPLAIDLLFVARKPSILILTSLVWALLLSIPLFLVDSFYYGRWVFAPLNIMIYNLLGQFSVNNSGSASQLYGTEPLTFYVKNYLLNFNIAFPFACFFSVGAGACLLGNYFGLFRVSTRECSSYSPTLIDTKRLLAIFVAPFLVWNVIFFLQKHKEERFLFPCYPLLALTAASCLVTVLIYLFKLRWFGEGSMGLLTILVVSLFLSLSFSRILCLIHWYGAPIYLTRHLPSPSTLPLTEKPLLCLARDWHYFPSRFLLPEGGGFWRVAFLRSDFTGQLPGEYKSDYGLSVIQFTRMDGSVFNVNNQEELDRYVPGGASSCQFILDRDSAPGSREELYSTKKTEWTVIGSRNILDRHSCSSSSSSEKPLSSYLTFWYPYICPVLRSFFVPYLSEAFTSPVSMQILQNRNLSK